MRRLSAASLAIVALAASAASPPGAPVGAPAAAPASPDPCAAAKARIPARLEAVVAPARAELDAYRASWTAACDPARGAADLAALLSEADVLVTDVRTGRVVADLAAALGPEGPWPLPGIHRHGEVFDVDWAVFAAFAPRGTAEDGRYFRGLARATRPDGGPVWLGEGAPGGAAPCVRLGEVSWVEVARGIEEMERSRSEIYARQLAPVREQLLATLAGLARGGVVCGCVRGDPLAALDALAAERERVGTPAHRALVAAAAAAADAVRGGRTRVAWLRAAPGAPATGCGAASP